MRESRDEFRQREVTNSANGSWRCERRLSPKMQGRVARVGEPGASEVGQRTIVVDSFDRKANVMVRGKCKLCLKEKDLQDSHLLPRALYRMARGDGAKGNQDLFVVTRQESKQSSHQTKDYLLCRDCEQLFSRNGEAYAMRLVTKQNGDFPLLAILTAVRPTVAGSEWRAYSFADTPTIARAKIAYFALSVFWRASVHTWVQANGERTHIELGTKYNDQIRRYLLDETAVPRNTSLQVFACSDRVNQKTFFTPRENKRSKIVR
ncbi:MAG TPA: hypothetical protein VNO32_38745 [Candidatus Acidoferrum sp.]|nr:hypothetical protein [Candidatus Acidoferrum sp.]